MLSEEKKGNVALKKSKTWPDFQRRYYCITGIICLYLSPRINRPKLKRFSKNIKGGVDAKI